MSVSSSRHTGYDVARALAILGMVLVDYTSLMEVAEFSPSWLKSIVDFIYGRAAVVFVMLAGLSVSLMAARRPGPVPVHMLRTRLLKRSLLLLLAGMALRHWWEADILHFYAVYIAFGAWAMTWRPGRLRGWTVLILGLSIPVCAALTTACDLGESAAFAAGRGAVARLLLDYAISPYYAVCPWLGFFLAGMLIGRREPADASFWRRGALIGLLICLAVEIVSTASMAWVGRNGIQIEGNWWVAFLRTDAFPATPLFIVSAGAGSVALISACRTVFSGALKNIPGVNALAGFGRLSLTLYVAHIGWGIIYKHGMNDAGTGLGSNQMFQAVGIFASAGFLFTIGWCRYFQRGPLETVFHQLTSGKFPKSGCPLNPSGQSHVRAGEPVDPGRGSAPHAISPKTG